MKKSLIVALVAMLSSCTTVNYLEQGVSRELASYRLETIKDLRYSLSMDLVSPGFPSREKVNFVMDERAEVVFDFTGVIESLSVNGIAVEPQVENGHIVIPADYTSEGMNEVNMEFHAGTSSMNIREDFLYTLLVPDRARTLFPCMDQPDLKARYTLSLSIHKTWTALSNSSLISETVLDSSKIVRFGETKPLSTYLFSFVAGVFQKITYESDNRSVSMYYRETDPKKIAECPEIMKLVFSSIAFMEEYTGVPYPFDKYDFAVIPDFQYGGMEHAGATLYNDRRIFLGESPTTMELLDRQSLISHETAHMWFGDLVTMEWFDDVWIKEVFANWFAARMARPGFPEINHTLSDLKNYFAPAYVEDRTEASNAISRPLSNLQEAGLIYCNTIYDKSPIVMDKLYHMLGEVRFRKGLSEYLKRYSYANASWDDLVEILCSDLPDIKEWCDTWVKSAGMPVYSTKISGHNVKISCNGSWQQELTFRAVSKDGQYEDFHSTDCTFDFPVSYVIPNIDGLGYGCFETEFSDSLFMIFPKLQETERMSVLMTLYENTVRGNIAPSEFLRHSVSYITAEQNPIIFGAILDYFGKISILRNLPMESEQLLVTYIKQSNDAEKRLLAIRTLAAVMRQRESLGFLYNLWYDDTCSLPERDLTELSYEIMIRMPEQYDSIRLFQRGRISNPDRLQTFDYVSMAASSDTVVRDSIFHSFTNVDGRRPESRVISALNLLSHFTREEYARKYIVPGLELLPEIQKTGDIFFPAKWCRVLLANHCSDECKDTVHQFVTTHNYSPLLETKILQALPY